VRRRGSSLAAIAGAVLLTVVAAPRLGAAVSTRSVGAAIRQATPADAPFKGLTATTLHIGGRALHVVVAKTDSQRQRGLRQRSDLGRYDAMLFVFSGDTTVGFTMSTVPVPLNIGFYRSNGRTVGNLRMVPCRGTDASCPVYRAGGAFRYAVETLDRQLPAGSLSG
jgi:uncharacterized membrane protein (UPF0127 family)